MLVFSLLLSLDTSFDEDFSFFTGVNRLARRKLLPLFLFYCYILLDSEIFQPADPLELLGELMILIN